MDCDRVSFQKDFGDNLRRARESNGLLQKQLAQQIGVTSSAISQYEIGLRLPSLKTVAHIAYVLDVSVSDLIPSPGMYFAPEVSKDQTTIFDYMED